MDGKTHHFVTLHHFPYVIICAWYWCKNYIYKMVGNSVSFPCRVKRLYNYRLAEKGVEALPCLFKIY